MTIISFIAEIFYIPGDSAAAEPIRRRPSAKQTPAHVSAHWSWVWGLAANQEMSFYVWALGCSQHWLREPASVTGQGGAAQCRGQAKKQVY